MPLFIPYLRGMLCIYSNNLIHRACSVPLVAILQQNKNITLDNQNTTKMREKRASGRDERGEREKSASEETNRGWRDITKRKSCLRSRYNRQLEVTGGFSSPILCSCILLVYSSSNPLP